MSMFNKVWCHTYIGSPGANLTHKGNVEMDDILFSRVNKKHAMCANMRRGKGLQFLNWE
jgi:hypothetical protein